MSKFTIIKNQIQGISTDGNLFEIAEKILNLYYKKLYTGTENSHISLLYFDLLLWEITDWLGQNMNYLKQDKKIKKLENFISKSILQAQINTYQTRKNMFHLWLGGLEQYTKWKHIKLNDLQITKDFLEQNKMKQEHQMNSKKLKKEEFNLQIKLFNIQRDLKEYKIVYNLLNRYKTYDFNTVNEVKRELGLNKTKAELEQKLKDL